MPTFTRVRDRSTGHQYDIDERAFDKELHERLNAERWPDISGTTAQPRPAKYSLTPPAGSTPPKGNASQAEWAAYAVDALGADADEVADLTRDELRERFGATEPTTEPPPPGDGTDQP